MLPATTGELEFVFHSSGVVADTAGGCCCWCCCWTLAHIGCSAALGTHDCETTTDDSGDATLMTGCGTVNACDFDGVGCDNVRCNQQIR